MICTGVSYQERPYPPGSTFWLPCMELVYTRGGVRVATGVKAVSCSGTYSGIRGGGEEVGVDVSGPVALHG